MSMLVQVSSDFNMHRPFNTRQLLLEDTCATHTHMHSCHRHAFAIYSRATLLSHVAQHYLLPTCKNMLVSTYSSLLSASALCTSAITALGLHRICNVELSDLRASIDNFRISLQLPQPVRCQRGAAGDEDMQRLQARPLLLTGLPGSCMEAAQASLSSGGSLKEVVTFYNHRNV